MLQVVLQHGEMPEDIVSVLRDAARLARGKSLGQMLVISGVEDPATAVAVSHAMDGIHDLGAPLPASIAFVACMLPQYSAYHFAERYAERLGISVKVFASVDDAKSWLRVR